MSTNNVRKYSNTKKHHKQLLAKSNNALTSQYKRTIQCKPKKKHFRMHSFDDKLLCFLYAIQRMQHNLRLSLFFRMILIIVIILFSREFLGKAQCVQQRYCFAFVNTDLIFLFVLNILRFFLDFHKF